ncbi:general substrate transporter [Neofusicoccum parvum]|uniref:General substrate transporter n=1 Tax=Neofusicoccum parvum TaxID=310453 RepID=A0ACB5SLH6_9PEZI|nr:general substrate transporter [Neofusicoccum parvum]
MISSYADVLEGYDGASFAGVQAFKPFAKHFGACDSNGACALTPKIASLMNSLALVGKLAGTLIVGPLTEKLGHKKTMFFTCSTQILGVIVQVTSKTVAQFTVSRILIYIAVGLVENVTPTYQSEISPGALRGFFVGSIQLFLTFGSLIAGIVNNEMAKSTTQAGWMTASALQALPAGIIIVGLPFTPESPRWLLSKDRGDEALAILGKLRPAKDVQDGMVNIELTAIGDDQMQQVESGAKKEPWSSLFKGTNLRRTLIATGIMALQQLTGAINNGVSVVTAIIGMILFDTVGRRSVTFYGCILQAVFLCLIGALGAKTDRSASDTDGMVASFIIYAAILHMSLGPAAYITAAEIGTSTLREKTMSFSTAVNVIVGFIVVSTTPYLMNPAYADLGANLGYVWGGFSALGAVWIWLCLPELKDRTLEETDEIFTAGLPAWKFKGYQTSSPRSAVAMFPGNGDLSDMPKDTALELETAKKA